VCCGRSTSTSPINSPRGYALTDFVPANLDLPLEQWVCAPRGPRVNATHNESSCCVFCNEPDPSEEHIELHHYSACQQRGVEDRTFKRKDHLNQHLRLFHNVKYADWPMNQWKESVTGVHSRCGFCDIHMSTWSERTEHLAEHFKAGKTMADWNGEWGFEPAVLKMVEGAVPPYLIDFERTTIIPFEAGMSLSSFPRNAYELLKIELDCFSEYYFDANGRIPTSDQMQLEACRIIFASDTSSSDDIFDLQIPGAESWLRDLIMSSPHLAQQARFEPLRLRNEGRLPELKIQAQRHLFTNCPLEEQLNVFVQMQRTMEPMVSDCLMQREAHGIIIRMEEHSVAPNRSFANWLIGLIYSDASWLSGFTQRANITTERSFEPDIYSGNSAIIEPYGARLDRNHELVDTTGIDDPLVRVQSNPKAGIRPGTFFPGDLNFYSWFVRDLTRWVAATMSPQNPNYHIPSDDEIQFQARRIIYDG
jgi:hypothetical protein